MIADLHNDFPTDARALHFLKEYNESGNIVVGAVFKGKRTYERCFAAAKALSEGKRDNILLAYEDFSFDVSFAKLEALLDLEPLYVTLTWNGENALGGGAGAKGGLTSRGRDVIRLLNERGITVDLAHLNEQSYFEALSLADRVICSHTALSSVNRHKRNLSDGQISALLSRGGLLGLAFYPPFLNGTDKADVSDVIRHIDRFVEKFGASGLCIGSDINGCDVYASGFSDYGFEETLKKELSSRGYDERVVNGIFYGNFTSAYGMT